MKLFGEVVKSHELVGLGKKVGLEKRLLGHCEELSSLYVACRYPGLAEDVDEAAAKTAISSARQVFEWAKSRLT